MKKSPRIKQFPVMVIILAVALAGTISHGPLAGPVSLQSTRAALDYSPQLAVEEKDERSFIVNPQDDSIASQVTSETTDVTVEEIKMRPEFPMVGMRVDFIVLLLNSGSAVDTNTTFYLDEQPIYSLRSNLTSPRDHVKLSASWKAVRGAHILRVKAEALNVTDTAPESNELSLLVNVAVPLYEFLIIIDTTLRFGQTDLTVDGALVRRLCGGETETLKFENGTTHEVTVSDKLEPVRGIRFFALNQSIEVDSEGKYTFMYRAEYFLEVAVQPPIVTEITGSGWKPEGETIALSAPESPQGKAEGVRYDFLGWATDGSGLISQTVIQVFMDRPHNATAVYQILYLVRVLGEKKCASLIGNDTWYEAGVTLDLVVTNSTCPLEEFWAQVLGGKQFASPPVFHIPKLSSPYLTSLRLNWIREDYLTILSRAVFNARTIVEGFLALLSAILTFLATRRCWTTKIRVFFRGSKARKEKQEKRNEGKKQPCE